MQRAARGTGPTARLAAPLAEHERERAERLVEYERAQEEVGKWQPIVKRNREAEQLRCAQREREKMGARREKRRSGGKEGGGCE